MIDQSPVVIDVISDVMCPWCYIGKKRLDNAIAHLPQIPVKIKWHPYQLDPNLPKEGKDRTQYLLEKFGGKERARDAYSHVRKAGAAESIPFNFEHISKSPNTIDSHRLIMWARNAGKQNAMVEELFSLYFVQGADLTSRAVLADAAGRVGLDKFIVQQLLRGDKDVARVKAEINKAHEIGVTGVPFFIIDGRFALVGAEETQTIAAAIQHASETKAMQDHGY